MQAQHSTAKLPIYFSLFLSTSSFSTNLWLSCSRIAAAAFAVCALGVSAVADAGTLQAYAFSAGGQSTNPTTGPTDYMRYNYPGGQSGKYYAFTPGPGFNVQESLQYFSAANGPLTAASAVSTSVGPTASYVGSSQSYSSYGQLGVAASGNYTGATNSSAVRGSEAFATYTESFTIAGAAGQTGYFIPTFTVDGAWSKSGSAAVQFQMEYNVNSGPTYLLYRIQGDSANPPSLWSNGYVDSLPGLTVTPTSVTGSTTVSIQPIAFQFNQAFDLTIALFAGVIPYSNGSGAADFLHTSLLSGISILDSNGQALTDFSIVSGSGTSYSAEGVQAVPIPAAAWLFGSALMGLTGACRLRNRTRPA